MLRRSTLLFFALPLACGGSSRNAGGGGLSASSDAPEWVNHGSHVEKGSIFGVGSVEGIKNNNLARTTAENRARAEISKILEVYSASLMKDYQASTTAGDMKTSSEEQSVQQAIKTFSANLEKGAEVKDMYVDSAKGSMWCLVELNFERSREAAAAQARMGSAMKDWIDRNGAHPLDDMEHGTPRTAQGGGGGGGGGSQPPPVAKNPPSTPPPPPVQGPTAKVGGPAPAWTQGQCDQARYLCGVGSGREMQSADVGARSELARIFQSNIVSVQKSFESASQQISSKTGETWTETQNVSQFSMVSTDKQVTMSEILERWDDGKGKMWSLAVIDRAQASAALRDQIQQKDSLVGSQIDRAKSSSDKLARFKALRSAVSALAEREALNSDLRVIQKSGTGVPPAHNVGEIVAMLDSATEALSIGIALSGSGSDRVQACLEEKMTEKGYQVQSNTVEDEDDNPNISGSFDVLIKGTIKNEDRGQISGTRVVNTTLTLKLINGKTGKVLRTFTGQEKASRPSIQSAASTSAFKVCQKQVPNIVSDIDRAFSR
jgi:hypothetical protein